MSFGEGELGALARAQSERMTDMVTSFQRDRPSRYLDAHQPGEPQVSGQAGAIEFVIVRWRPVSCVFPDAPLSAIAGPFFTGTSGISLKVPVQRAETVAQQ